MTERFTSYAEFWPHYLREHSRAPTRALHYFGTGLAVLCIVGAAASQYLWLIGVAAIAGYGPAWIAHGLIEHNRPATFTHPWWSLISDFRMLFFWLTGRLSPELHKAGVDRQDEF
ncbi:MAG: DUF962 domain-containing protein [Alphaproteobacteria bacterium]|nr:DUF962 domain-containing protein [Alphaproteobacteria bacterium]